MREAPGLVFRPGASLRDQRGRKGVPRLTLPWLGLRVGFPRTHGLRSFWSSEEQ